MFNKAAALVPEQSAAASSQAQTLARDAAGDDVNETAALLGRELAHVREDGSSVQPATCYVATQEGLTPRG